MNFQELEQGLMDSWMEYQKQNISTLSPQQSAKIIEWASDTLKYFARLSAREMMPKSMESGLHEACLVQNSKCHSHQSEIEPNEKPGVSVGYKLAIEDFKENYKKFFN